MGKKRNGFSGAGISSLIIVFAVLSLTIFSVLSLLTVRQQVGLSKKNADTQTGYYNADYRATKKFNMLSILMLNNADNLEEVAEENEAEISRGDDGSLICSFKETINDKMHLRCEFYSKEGVITISRWISENTSSIEENNNEHQNINNRPF